jgi:hypothetical protein
MVRPKWTAALAAGVLFFCAYQGVAAAASANFNDAARFLAGMQPSDESPLVAATRNPEWKRHAKAFDSAWDTLEVKQLSRIRVWAKAHLPDRSAPLYYMFSGPDFLYANAFFPNATTYVMSGLEPVGPVPDVTERTIRSLPRIQASLAASLKLSFFRTREMRERLHGGELAGTLPLLYVFIARSGKTISDVVLVRLDPEGNVHNATDADAPRKAVPGVKIVFSDKGGPQQTLYYFQTDVSDTGVKTSGFLEFVGKLGMGDGLLKSASYLMHSAGFNKVRDVILAQSQALVQDDSGIPVSFFKAEDWQLSPFGKYLGPIEIFPGREQPRLRELYRKGNPPPLEFGIGYRWRGFDSNLLLAVKKDLKVPDLKGPVAKMPDKTPPVQATKSDSQQVQKASATETMPATQVEE